MNFWVADPDWSRSSRNEPTTLTSDPLPAM